MAGFDPPTEVLRRPDRGQHAERVFPADLVDTSVNQHGIRVSRHRPGQLAAVFAPRLSARACVFVLLTACRFGEAKGANSDEVDLDAREWRIAATRIRAARDAAGLCRSCPALADRGRERMRPV